jgi:hypothetical protein
MLLLISKISSFQNVCHLKSLTQNISETGSLSNVLNSCHFEIKKGFGLKTHMMIEPNKKIQVLLDLVDLLKRYYFFVNFTYRQIGTERKDKRPMVL